MRQVQTHIKLVLPLDFQSWSEKMAVGRFLHPYYLSNFGLLLLYPVLRLSVLQPSNQPSNPLPFQLNTNSEPQILSTMAVVLFFKYIKSATVEEFLGHCFFLLRLTLSLLLYLFSGVACAWFVVAQTMVWLLTSRPMYAGPNKFKQILTMRDFERVVLEGEGTFVVLFYAPWNDACFGSMPLWADMSVKYTTPQLQFMLVNVETTPLVAKKCVVDTSGVSRQLPSLLLYEKGVEVARFPPVGAQGSMPQVVRYRFKEIADYLGLERRWLATNT